MRHPKFSMAVSNFVTGRDLGHVRQTLIDKVAAEFGNHIIRSDSFFFWKEEEDPSTQTSLYSAMWSPSRGQLVGGPYDGTIFPVLRDAEGFPPLIEKVQFSGAPRFEAARGLATYRRDYAEWVSDIWIYRATSAMAMRHAD